MCLFYELPPSYLPETMVNCELLCKKWYHYDCLGLTDDEIAKLEVDTQYCCPECTSLLERVSSGHKEWTRVELEALKNTHIQVLFVTYSTHIT